jgi:hypothetical protein
MPAMASLKDPSARGSLGSTLVLQPGLYAGYVAEQSVPVPPPLLP